MPENAMFYLDIRNGKAYFRGDIHADNGYFRGEVHATSGDFTGTLKACTIEAGTIKGDLISDPKDGGWLVGCGIKVGQNPSAPYGYNFYVDPDGNVNINKGSISWGAVTGTDEIDQRIQNAQDTADDALGEASSTNDNLLKLVKGQYTAPSATFISGKKIMSPTIEAGTITSVEMYGSDIYGGAFYDLKGKSKLVLNPSETQLDVADLVLYGGGNGRSTAFSVYDNIGSITLSGYGVPSLTISKNTNATHPVGTWDFSNATVKGITAVFQ